LSARRVGAASLAAIQPERDGEANAVVEMVTGDANVSIVYGDPGSGKTSLVHGAVLPLLEAAGWRVWYVTVVDQNPVNALIQAGLSAGVPRGAGADDWAVLQAMLEAAQTPAPGLIVVLDHVGPYLQRHQADTQPDEFWGRLSHVVSSSLRLLLIGRTDVLPLAIRAVQQVDASLQDPPQHHLPSFTCEQALDALVSIADASGLALERRLAERIVRDLAIDNQVSPAELQIVLDSLFWGGVVTLPGYRLRHSARGAERRYFTGRWRARVQDRGGDWNAQVAVLARLAEAEPPRGSQAERAGIAAEQLGAGATAEVLTSLITDHLIERRRSGTYRLAEPGLAASLRGLGKAQAWRDDALAAAGARAAAALAWCGHLPRLGLGGVAAAMVGTIALVVYLIVAGYPQGRELASLRLDSSLPLPAGGAFASDSALDLVAFDPLGRYLAADAGQEIVVWDLRNGNTVFRRLSKAGVNPMLITDYLTFVGADEVRLYGVNGEVWAWQLSTGDFIRQDQQPIAVSQGSDCAVSAATVNSSGRLLAQGTSCGVVRVLDVDAGVETRSFSHNDAKCRSAQLAFSRAQNQLLEFYKCKSDNDVIQLTPWSLGPVPAGQDSTPGISGDLVKVEYLPDGNPYVLTVTQQETHLWELARNLARSRWPLAVYDGAPTDLAPDGRVLAVGFAGEIRLYERAEWPFEFIPVKDSAKGLFPQPVARSASD
jgi:hypothetical protein